MDQCIICDSLSYVTDAKASTYLNLPSPYSVSKCKQCGFRWLNPQPTDKEYEKVYGPSYFKNETSSQFLEVFSGAPLDDEVGSEIIRSREAWYCKKLKRLKPFLPSAEKILDIGAGTGEFLSVARDMGWEVRGLETSSFACKKAREHFDLELDNVSLKDFNPLGASFDVVHLSNVFEYFTDPIGVLEKVSNLVGEGGLVIIEVPNKFISWTDKISDIKRGVKQIPRSLDSIHHPYFYSPKHLKLMLRKIGFVPVSLKTFFIERWPGGLNRKVLMLIDYFSSIFNRGRNIELIARRW